MANKLSQFTIEDIRRANGKMVAQSANSAHSSTAEIKLTANGKTKVISTKVNAAQIREAYARATKK